MQDTDGSSHREASRGGTLPARGRPADAREGITTYQQDGGRGHGCQSRGGEIEIRAEVVMGY